jgi:hypothetical protein
MAQVRNSQTGQTLTIPDDQVPFMSSQWQVVGSGGGSSSTPAPTSSSWTPPAGTELINGAQYNTTASQQAAYDNIQVSPDGRSLYGTPKMAPTQSAGFTGELTPNSYGRVVLYALDESGAQKRTTVDPNNPKTQALLAAGWTPDRKSAVMVADASARQSTPVPPAVENGGGATPVAGGVDQTGWSQAMMDAYSAMQGYIKTLTDQGKTVNPNITIDQATIDKFTGQAKDELGPYYESVFSQAQDDLNRSIERIKQDYAAGEQELGQKYGKALESTQEDYARRGLGFSSERDKAEKLLADRAETALASWQQTTRRSAEDVGGEAVKLYGSRNLPSQFNYNVGAAPIQRTPGVYGFTNSRSRTGLFDVPVGITGSYEQQRLYDERSRVNELTNAERQLRGFNIQ